MNRKRSSICADYQPLPCYYTDHAGLEIPVDLRIASSFSRQIAIGNAGPSLALESGSKTNFSLPFFKYWS